MMPLHLLFLGVSNIDVHSLKKPKEKQTRTRYCILYVCYSADTRTMNAMALFSLYLYFFFTYFIIFFRTSQSQPRVDATAETFFLVIFKVVPWFQTTAETFFQIFSDFLSITVFPLLYNGGIFHQWNYNGAFWRKYYYLFHLKTRNKWNATYLFRRQT